MKAITVIVLSCILFSACLKKDNSNGKKPEERQKILFQETFGQEVQKPDTSYLFDIDSFKYINEFPRTITGIKEMYPDEPFEESVFEITGSEITGKWEGPPGKYMYILRSADIRFDFFGDTDEEANLYAVDIFNSNYQCKSIQVIGMSTEELERVSGRKLNSDKNIAIYTKLYDGLIIKTKDGFVQSYSIIAPF